MTPYLLLLIAANNAHDNIQSIARDICVQSPDIAWQQPVWLSPEHACEIPFIHDDRVHLDDLLQTIQAT